jgi:hypothetical protein
MFPRQPPEEHRGCGPLIFRKRPFDWTLEMLPWFVQVPFEPARLDVDAVANLFFD